MAINLRKDDFPVDVPQELVDELNKIDLETEKLENKSKFCREHAFLREAEYVDTIIRARTGVVVGICNSLGKYF